MFTAALRFLTLACALSAGFTSLQAEHWPRFRGPSGQGLSSERRLPLTWSGTSGVRWIAEIPGDGWSSPIVWDDRVYLTTATGGGASCRMLSLDRRTGRVMWDREIVRQTLRRKEEKNSYATPTPATDGRRIYASCGDGSFAALNLDGTIAWTNRTLPFYSQHGLGTSLVLHDDLVIMARDGSTDGPTPDDKKIGWQIPWDRSFVVALDAATGRMRWQTPRGPSRIAHPTPIVARIGARDVLVSNAGDVIQTFDPRSGTRLWSIESFGEGVVPSPVRAGDLIVSVSGFGRPTIRAVRAGPPPSVAWEQTKGVPMQSSPVHVAPYLYTVTDGGVLSALDANTGTVAWQERLGGTYSASPVAAAGRIYWLSEDCVTVVIEPGSAFKELARNALPGRCQASMAVAGGELFIRTDRRLFAIGGGE